jgi:DNA-binding response OmpR family regulator
MKASKILLIEKECIIAMEIQKTLTELGYQIFTSISGDKGLEMAFKINPDLIIIDLNLADGIKTAKRLREFLDIPLIYLAAYINDKILEEAKLTKPSHIILKPFNMDELIDRIKIALEKSKLDRDGANRELLA